MFRGRGEHPKMGKLKKRIYPKDITINIGEGVALPDHPYPGQQWKEVCCVYFVWVMCVVCIVCCVWVLMKTYTRVLMTSYKSVFGCLLH